MSFQIILDRPLRRLQSAWRDTLVLHRLILKIGVDSECELFDEYLFKGENIILFVKQKHSFLVIDRVYRAER